MQFRCTNRRSAIRLISREARNWPTPRCGLGAGEAGGEDTRVLLVQQGRRWWVLTGWHRVVWLWARRHIPGWPGLERIDAPAWLTAIELMPKSGQGSASTILSGTGLSVGGTLSTNGTTELP